MTPTPPEVSRIEPDDRFPLRPLDRAFPQPRSPFSDTGFWMGQTGADLPRRREDSRGEGDATKGSGGKSCSRGGPDYEVEDGKWRLGGPRNTSAAFELHLLSRDINEGKGKFPGGGRGEYRDDWGREDFLHSGNRGPMGDPDPGLAYAEGGWWSDRPGLPNPELLVSRPAGVPPAWRRRRTAGARKKKKKNRASDQLGPGHIKHDDGIFK